jgi:hypothetical protein
MVLEDNKVAALGNFAAITASGFDIVEILQSQNKAMSKDLSKTVKQRAEQAGVELEIEMSPEPNVESEDAKEGNLDELKILSQKTEKVNLIVDEEQDTGAVTFTDVQNFLSYSYGCLSYPIFLFVGTLSSVLQLYSTFFLAEWTS